VRHGEKWIAGGPALAAGSGKRARASAAGKAVQRQSDCRRRPPRDARMAGRVWSIEAVLFHKGYDMLRTAIPVIHVSDSAVAEEFYCEGLGFNLLSSWRPHKTNRDPCYMVLVRDNAHLHLTSFKDGMVGAWTSTVYVFVEDIDALHAELVAKGNYSPRVR
jgi:Glyoxalase superfamily protein